MPYCNTFCQALDSGKEVRAVFCNLTVCDMLISLLNFKQLVSQETSTPGLQIISQTESNELFSQALLLIRLTFLLEFHGDRY